MPKFWQNRMLLGYSVVCAIGFYLVMMQLDSLKRLGDAQQAMARPASPVTIRPLNMERVFSFPETTCGPDPKPVFYGASIVKHVRQQSVNVAGLVRDQFRYGMLLSGCLLTGLILGFALTYRAAQRETRFAYLKSSFVSNMSHEMKTPLATIQMFAETLESGRIQDPAKMAEYHRVIKKESLRLGQLIEDVLDFSRMESEMHTFRFAPVGIAGLLRPLAEDFRQQVEHQGGTFRTSISDDLPVLAIDAKSMAQAVQNLLSNALKYSPEMKWIVLSAEERNNQICISVSDRGIGIAPTEREKIFEKFYRAESDLVHNTKGAGLGLAMVRQIVKAHHGQVIVESEPGKGSRFTIQLPIEKHGAQAA